MANPSFRVYYGRVSVAVPFMWESQPGKPKYKLCESTLPPLTPPPSYYSASNKKPTRKHSRSNLLHILFPRIIIKRTNASALPSTNSASTPSPTPSSASRSSLISPGPLSPAPRKHRGQSLGLSFNSGAHDEDPPSGSPTSTLRFSTSRGNGGRFRGCYGWSS